MLFPRWIAFSALTLLVGLQERHPACKKLEWWGAGVVICLELGADLHVAQLMPLPLTVSCFSKVQIGFTFPVPAHLGSPGQGPLNGSLSFSLCFRDECGTLVKSSSYLSCDDTCAHCQIVSLKQRWHNFRKKFFEQISHSRNCLYYPSPTKCDLFVSTRLWHSAVYPFFSIRTKLILFSFLSHALRLSVTYCSLYFVCLVVVFLSILKVDIVSLLLLLFCMYIT